jgi:hypothetical protein
MFIACAPKPHRAPYGAQCFFGTVAINIVLLRSTSEPDSHERAGINGAKEHRRSASW